MGFGDLEASFAERLNGALDFRTRKCIVGATCRACTPLTQSSATLMPYRKPLKHTVRPFHPRSHSNQEFP